MKHDTLISAAILTVVTVVVIGVWTQGFGVFKRLAPTTSRDTMAAVWGGPPMVGGQLTTPGPAAPVNALPGLVTATEPMPIAVPVEPDVAVTSLIAPNYVPETLQLYEAHWQGLDGRLLTAELRRKLGYPIGLEGVLLGEVTLAAARAGLLGGDVIVAVEGQTVTNLSDFQEATRTVANRKQATLSVLRKTKTKDQSGARFTVIRLTLLLASDRELGFAQAESAPMIKAGDPRPHSERGACTQCHAIGTGFELRPDPDLITLPPPPIARGVAEKRLRPHEDRGPCEACHVITP